MTVCFAPVPPMVDGRILILDFFCGRFAMSHRSVVTVLTTGVLLTFAGLAPDAALRAIDDTALRLGLPVADPMRGGEAFARLVDACLA